MAAKTRSFFLRPSYYYTINIIVVLDFLIIISHSQSQTDPDSYYNACKPFTCGNITFSFPFSSYETFGTSPFNCGLPRFQITCDNTSSLPASIQLSGRRYQVRDLFLSNRLLTVVDQQLIVDLNSGSCRSIRNMTIPTSNDGTPLVDLTLPFTVNLTALDCRVSVSLSKPLLDGVVGNYSCTSEGTNVYFWEKINRGRKPGPDLPGPIPGGCEYVSVPVVPTDLNLSAGAIVTDLLEYGFPLQWPNLTECENCKGTGGPCGYDGKRIVCFCKGLPPNLDTLGGCLHKPKKSNKWKVIAGAVTGSICVLLAAVLLLVLKYKQRISAIFKPAYCGDTQMTGNERNAKEFVKNYQSTLLLNYSYSEVKKMTNGFKEKLGEGGYGIVYKGRLSDGRLIAVKMLENYKDKSQNFLNEVTTIGMIHHVNVIRLLGFCWDGSKQAIIYEYMPNKSLGDLMSNRETSISLGVAKLLEIAIGVAHGIEYLHNGCDSRILHLDIKPQNVLLDSNFNPKISDFGLAKAYSRNRSAVTMTGARGTIGYIAPEIFLRNLGNPSHKSDVYSFGMLLLEIVGANKHVKPDVNTSSSEAYFPGWIYDKLTAEREMEHELLDSVVGEEVYIARKMVMVGLWCIQTNPRDRPSMTRVVEMLCGDVEAIEMPPKPFFLSPPRVQLEGEITSLESESSVLPLTSGSQET